MAVLTIALQTLILSLFCLYLKGAIASPFSNKILVELNLSEPPQKKIRVVDSDEFEGAMNYTTKRNYRASYIIGHVTDAGEIIIDGDPRVMSRYVLAWLKSDMTKYVRVISRYRTSGNFYTHIKEFIKKPGDSQYSEVARTPLTLNVLTQKTDENINVVEVLSDEDNSGGSYKEYTIKKDKMDDVIIGEVRYGKYIVNNRIEDLISRKVTLEGGEYDPRITITSRYNNGTDLITSYIYVGGDANKFYVWEDKRKMITLLE